MIGRAIAGMPYQMRHSFSKEYRMLTGTTADFQNGVAAFQ
jgi:hypothetical protein